MKSLINEVLSVQKQILDFVVGINDEVLRMNGNSVTIYLECHKVGKFAEFWHFLGENSTFSLKTNYDHWDRVCRVIIFD